MSESFKRGDRVEMTKEAINQGLDGRKKRRTGIVSGTANEDLIYVRRHGISQAERWAKEFWRKKP